MSDAWNKCEQEQLKNLIKHDRFKLTLIINDDLAVYKYTSKNKDEMLHLGLLGFSLDPENESILFWIKDEDSSYSFKEVLNKEFFSSYPHRELLGKKATEKLGEVIKKWP